MNTFPLVLHCSAAASIASATIVSTRSCARWVKISPDACHTYITKVHDINGVILRPYVGTLATRTRVLTPLVIAMTVGPAPERYAAEAPACTAAAMIGFRWGYTAAAR